MLRARADSRCTTAVTRMDEFLNAYSEQIKKFIKAFDAFNMEQEPAFLTASSNVSRPLRAGSLGQDDE